MSAVQIAGFAVCAAALALVMRRLRPESATALVIAAGALTGLMVLPRLAAGLPVSRAELVGLGHGGLCLGCKECHYPICPFGKGV